MNNKLKKKIDMYFSDRIEISEIRLNILKIIHSIDELDNFKNELKKIKKDLNINKKNFDNTVFSILISGRISKVDKLIQMSNSIQNYEIKSKKKHFFIKN